MVTEDPGVFHADNGHSRCLLCGTLNPGSLGLSFQAGEDGVVRARFTADTLLQGYENILHGGVIASLLDAAMTHCLFHRGVQAVTADLHVRFIHPVFCNSSLEIGAWMLSSSSLLYRLKAEIVVDEQVVAWGEAKFMQRRSVQ
jgi:uncharacterized protein (TIGR00369 family)